MMFESSDSKTRPLSELATEDLGECASEILLACFVISLRSLTRLLNCSCLLGLGEFFPGGGMGSMFIG